MPSDLIPVNPCKDCQVKSVCGHIGGRADYDECKELYNYQRDLAQSKKIFSWLIDNPPKDVIGRSQYSESYDSMFQRLLAQCKEEKLCGTRLPFDGKHNLTVRQPKVTCKKCLAIINKQEANRG